MSDFIIYEGGPVGYWRDKYEAEMESSIQTFKLYFGALEDVTFWKRIAIIVSVGNAIASILMLYAHLAL